MIIDNFEFTDIPMFLHYREEFHNDLGGRTDEHLPLAALFGIVDAFKTVVENRNANHGAKKSNEYGGDVENLIYA